MESNMITPEELQDKVVRVYDEPDGWVEYVEYVENDGKIFMSAHTHTDKYSKKMMIKIAKTFLTFEEVYTILPYDYLVNFYNKHTHVELIDKKTRLYKVYGRRK